VVSSSPLEAFKEALREEYARRYQEEVKAIEDRLGDAIARRRREVEKEVSQMRLLQQEALQLRKDEIRSRILYELTEYLYSLGQELSEKVRQEVCARVASWREEGSLQSVEKKLFHEALEPFEEERVILSCLPEAPEEIRSHPRVAECLFFEEEEDIWGGCVLVDEATGTLVVDNRLSTRWNKVRHGLAKEIGSTMEELFDQVLRTVRELRIS
jgi:vacuolar-type H+-ATPase subunit E/Vma4